MSDETIDAPSQPALRHCEVPAALAAIRERFVSELALRRAELERALDPGFEICDRPDVLRKAERVAHRLSGVAATLGFPNLGDLASEADLRIGRALQCAGDLAAMTSAMDSLRTLDLAMFEVSERAMDCAPVDGSSAIRR